MLETIQTGVHVPQIMLPKTGIDLNKWAVVACDQFTSQPEYWESVDRIVADSPSTLRMILPEVWLESDDVKDRIAAVQATMRRYLDEGVFSSHRGMMLVERTVGNGVQTGLVIALDLETYDFNKGSQSLTRATEGTILDRLPPRMQVRRGAPIELPHILVLYDDPEMKVLEQVMAHQDQLEVAYDFDLMKDSGHLTGRWIDKEEWIRSIEEALATLIEPAAYSKKYDLPPTTAPLLFAMGDGNHSLATAKAIWEELKPKVSSDHPARYALVELVNLHDPSLQFEAIHRVLFNAPEALLDGLAGELGELVKVWPVTNFESMANTVNDSTCDCQRFGVITPAGYQVIEMLTPAHTLPVGNLQPYLDACLKLNPSLRIDYVHGDDVVDKLGRIQGNLAFYLPAIGKNAFFRTIIMDGALPRKTFSMGHAQDKRFYMECREIIPS